jgi:isopenicillin-N N-acyltransferase like protein
VSIKILNLSSNNPKELGHIHAEELKHQIKELAEIRMELMCTNDSGLKSRAEVMELASKHLPILKSFDENLFDELLGIAHASNLSLEEIVVINNYTDMRDIYAPYNALKGCSAIYDPTDNGPILGQTWDIHSSAIEYVVILNIKTKLEESILFSTAGCLGMTGFSSNHIGVTINNLSSIDAKVGLVWPALVRKILKQKSAKDAKDLVLNAPLGSGHHYTIADLNHAFAIDSSGSKKKVTFEDSDKMHFHTNHCIDNEMRKTHVIRKASSTFERFEILEKLLAEKTINSGAEMFELLGEVSKLPDQNNPTSTGTCGALVMQLADLKAYASKGPPGEKFNNPATILKI